MLYNALAQYRIDKKHENFHASDAKVIDRAFDKVVAAFTDLSIHDPSHSPSTHQNSLSVRLDSRKQLAPETTSA